MPYQRNAVGAVPRNRVTGTHRAAPPGRPRTTRLYGRLYMDLRRSSSALCPA